MDVLSVITICLVIFMMWKMAEWLVGKISVGSYKERFILITGCDSGFGNDAVIRFCQLRFNVFATCYTENSVADFQAYSNSHGRIYPLQLDVTKEEDVSRAGQFVRKTLPNGKGLWAIINNAGINTSIGPIEMLHRKHYEDCLNVNLYGVINITREFLPLLQMERGRVVNTSSLNGKVATPGSAPYNISKFAVEAYSDSLRREQYHFGVSVHIIEPSTYKTNITDMSTAVRQIRSVFDQAPDHVRQKYGEGYTEKAIGVHKQLLDTISSNKRSQVTDAYIHAVTSIAPKTRYKVGLLCTMLVPIVTFLPTKVTDLVFGKLFIKPVTLTYRR